MEDARFDDITRALLAGSRRGLLARLGASALMALFGRGGTDVAASGQEH